MMRRAYNRLILSALLAASLFGGKHLAHAQQAQAAPLSQAAVQRALSDAHKGDFSALDKIREENEENGDALKLFAEARFDSDAKVRRAVMNAAGDDYPSLLFLLPMMEDDNTDTAAAAASFITNIRRPQTQFRRLNAAQAAEVVRIVKSAIVKNPDFVTENPEVLLLLAQFKQVPEARALTSKLIRANHWDVSTATGNPTAKPIVWDRDLVNALVARCEIGVITSEQVLKVLKSNPKARKWFTNNVNLLADETLLRYAISLLQDETVTAKGDFDVDENRVSNSTEMSFAWATGLDLERTMVNGVRKYDKKEIRKLFAFYGLQMTPDEEARLTK